jgi:hypothetical protein
MLSFSRLILSPARMLLTRLTGNVRQMEEGMKIGYVRVLKQEQHEALQVDALKEAGCEKWFLDKIIGSKAERKGLDVS